MELEKTLRREYDALRMLSTSAITRVLWLMCLSITVLSACVKRPITTSVSMIIPARSVEATRIKRVAVLPFDHRRDGDISSQIESALANVEVNDMPFFVVVEHQHTNDIVSEFKHQEGPLIDPATAVKLGQMLGVEGVYFGTVTRSEVSDANFTEDRQRCGYSVTKRDSKGNTYSECQRTDTYSVRCVRPVHYTHL
jgi:hypothetical protein